MRFVVALVGLAACGSSAEKKAAPPVLAIEGHGVQLVPAPSTSATILPNGVLIFGPRADAPLPAEVKNVAVKPGKPPARALAPVPRGSITIYSDGADDTTQIATGAGMSTYEGVLIDASLSTRAGAWTIVAAGKETAWTRGIRLDVAADGKTFTLFTLPAK
jgi:hypothetical protein